MILGFKSVYGMQILSSLAAESALSFPLTPMWLGIQHITISLWLDTAPLLDTADSGAYTAGDVHCPCSLFTQTTQFEWGLKTFVSFPFSMLMDRVPHHVKDVCLVHGAETICSHITTQKPLCHFFLHLPFIHQLQLEVQAVSSNEMSLEICQLRR